MMRQVNGGSTPLATPKPNRAKAGLVCRSLVAALVLLAARDVSAQLAPLPLDDFSPAFLGMYRKIMEVEDDIRQYSGRYDVDFDLARAVCLYESGGNAGLASGAGAQGYFQVMPGTFRLMGVTTNIEAGVKYLSQMIHQFGREDRAVAAYNAGPGRVGRTGSLPMETLQYVVGVGYYRTVLKQYDESLRYHASRLQLATVRDGDDWSTLSGRLAIPDWQLRLHNPFLTGRRLRAGELVAYPPAPRQDLLTRIQGGAAYRMRHGDNYIKLAITLGLDLEALRDANGLWQIQSVPAGLVIRIPLSIDREDVIKAALTDGGVGPFAPSRPSLENARLNVPDAPDDPAEPTIAALMPQPAAPRDSVATPVRGAVAAERSRATSSVSRRVAGTVVVHRVQRGDTLTSIARRYGTTVSAIRQANDLRRTKIQVGQRLRVARGHSPEA